MVEETVVVDATVKGVSQGRRGKPEIQLDVPMFETDYPVVCSDFPEGFDTQVKIGQQVRLRLKRQNQKKNNNGTKYFHFYWGIEGLANAPLTEPAKASMSSDPAISIERQTAFKGAVALAVAVIGQRREPSMETILEEAQKAFEWIHGAEPKPLPKAAPTETSETPREGGFANIGAFLTAARGLGYQDTKAILDKLGVSKPVEIEQKYGSFDEAWKVVES